ncbi:MAG: cytochrome c oxidase subunit II [Candidatus Longimicrobiales bacterium M2_2A_002]
MKVHTYEKAFLWAGGVMLVVFMITLALTSYTMGISLPDDVDRIDPNQVREMPPFDNPGVRETAPGKYEVVMIGQAWSFTPGVVRVPAGAEVTFLMTTPDVIHGFHVEGTRLNVMLIPGQVARVSYTFEEPGEHLIICHEYCGIGHHHMWGRVIVEEEGA